MKRANEIVRWQKKLGSAVRGLCDEDSPAWWDGFNNVLSHGQTSCDDDNPYMNRLFERTCHKSYKAGAKAAESLLRHMKAEAKE